MLHADLNMKVIHSDEFLANRCSGVTPEGFWGNKCLVVTTLMKSSTTGHCVPLQLEDLLFCVHCGWPSWGDD